MKKIDILYILKKALLIIITHSYTWLSTWNELIAIYEKFQNVILSLLDPNEMPSKTLLEYEQHIPES